MNKLEWFFYCYPRYITFVTFGQEEEEEKKGTSYRRFQNHPFVNLKRNTVSSSLYICI